MYIPSRLFSGYILRLHCVNDRKTERQPLSPCSPLLPNHGVGVGGGGRETSFALYQGYMTSIVSTICRCVQGGKCDPQSFFHMKYKTTVF